MTSMKIQITSKAPRLALGGEATGTGTTLGSDDGKARLVQPILRRVSMDGRVEEKLREFPRHHWLKAYQAKESKW